GVEGREETLKGQVSGTKTTGNKQFSLSTFGSILIMFSILLFAVSMVSSIMKIWDFSYSLGIQVIAILSMVTGYTLRNKMIGPEANGKTYLLINTIHEFVTSKLIEREITEIPVYDISKHGELVTFSPPQDFDVVEQTWVSRPFTLVTILNNRRTHKNLYNISEPVLSDFEKALLQRIFDSLKVFLLEHEIDFNRMDKELILYKNFIKILDVYGIDLAPPSLHKIWYYMKRDYVGYGKLDRHICVPLSSKIHQHRDQCGL
ncbi:MAG: hypothetical protein O8C59_01760, partial [Candidatus Methanoperedens sp.]|nr:hypothetical protein [Candidatus Methanoperedens sp.]